MDFVEQAAQLIGDNDEVTLDEKIILYSVMGSLASVADRYSALYDTGVVEEHTPNSFVIGFRNTDFTYTTGSGSTRSAVKLSVQFVFRNGRIFSNIWGEFLGHRLFTMPVQDFGYSDDMGQVDIWFNAVFDYASTEFVAAIEKAA